jgi:hypothetical protein
VLALLSLSACHDTTTPTIDARAVVEASVRVTPEASVESSDEEPDADVHDMMDRAVRLLEEGGDIIQANMADCDAMGERMEAFRAAHLAGLKETDTIYETRFATEFERLKPTFRARYHAAWRRVQPGVNKCRKSPKMSKVILEIWGTEIPDAGPPP